MSVYHTLKTCYLDKKSVSLHNFESIPRQLSKEYKKFQYSTIRKGAKASQYTGSILTLPLYMTFLLRQL